MKYIKTIGLLLLLFSRAEAQQTNIGQKKSPTRKVTELNINVYREKAHAIWAGQIIATLLGLPAEHNVASVKWINKFPNPDKLLLLDDDWYYEMIAIRGFEKYGIDMSLEELAEMWQLHQCGSWGSSKETRLNLSKGLKPSLVGSPQYNRYWFTIGPQFSADVYGILAPGLPNLAGQLARKYGHINGYAEGVDGAVFVAGMISLGFTEKDQKLIVRKASQLINPRSPYRQCIDMVIKLADEGKSAQEVLNIIEEKWHIEYPATNNAVANGGIVAAALWFGEADFLKTINLASRSLDFTDSDCNAANAAGVIMAMKGFSALPIDLLKILGDRIKGNKMGDVIFNTPIDESITELGKRTALIGEQIMLKNGIKLKDEVFIIPSQNIITQSPELFRLSDYAKIWDNQWELIGAGFLGPKGGTYLDSDKNILVTYPRDEVRQLYLSRTMLINEEKQLTIKVNAETDKAWELRVYLNDTKVLTQIIEKQSTDEKWQEIKVDLSPYRGQNVKIRVFQNVLVKGKVGGNAYWKSLIIK